MHLTHPFRIAARQIVVHRDHVHSTAGKRIEIAGEGGHKRFALTGFHLGDLALVQHHATDHLHIEMAHAQHPLAGFTDYREGLWQQVVQYGSLFL